MTALGILRSAWKRVPHPARHAAHRAIKATDLELMPLRVAVRWRRGAPGGAPVIVAGLHRSSIGLGQGARLFAEGLGHGGLTTYPLDVGAHFPVPVDLVAGSIDEAPEETGGVIVTHLNPPELSHYLRRTDARALHGRRHIGYWAWELPIAPRRWRRAFGFLDEVWCPSTFTARAIEAIAPAGVPIRVVPHPVFVMPRPSPDRARFGLPAEACIVLLAFDLRSTAARKNPYGALEAYLRAVPEADGSAMLVCKVSGGAAFPALLADLQGRFSRREDLLLVTEVLSSEDMLRLEACADIVLSLHRAEGFALVLAEAMWLGKPTVATAWSGNMDFMSADTAALIDYTLEPVRDPQNHYYGGGVWASPDIAQAAQRLRDLIGDPAGRKAMGERARARGELLFNGTAWIRRTEELLNHGSPQPRRLSLLPGAPWRRTDRYTSRAID
jgi:glycosyltransferase involved in cell wall biosynthesis